MNIVNGRLAEQRVLLLRNSYQFFHFHGQSSPLYPIIFQKSLPPINKAEFTLWQNYPTLMLVSFFPFLKNLPRPSEILILVCKVITVTNILSLIC